MQTGLLPWRVGYSSQGHICPCPAGSLDPVVSLTGAYLCVFQGWRKPQEADTSQPGEPHQQGQWLSVGWGVVKEKGLDLG